MFDVQPSNRMTDTEKLLYNIWKCLDKEKLNTKDTLKKDIETQLIHCKACGETHANKGQMLACSRKHKKEANR